jgi:CubicO group peptidase (beta-lactamase class C family)
MASSLALAPRAIARDGGDNGSGDMSAIADALDQARAAIGTPGMAVAIVKDSAIVMSRGFGVKDVTTQEPVTDSTLFQIGSTSKAFTALALEMLAERPGEFRLKTKVRTILPDFAIADPVATELATPVDLLSHRTGLPRHDLTWYGSSLSRDELFQRLRYLQSSADFRDIWQYNNLMYMVAGRMVEALSGQSWEHYVHDAITAPLGMGDTVMTTTEFTASPEHATGHVVTDGVATVTPIVDMTNIAPAGSIGSSVRDLARWLQFNLGHGALGDVRLVTASTHTYGITPKMALPPAPTDGQCLACYPELRYPSYGLAWGTYDYRGERLVWHSGGIDGYLTWVSFMPDKGLGIVVLTNASSLELPAVASLMAYDRLLGLEPIDWTARALVPRSESTLCAGEDRQIPGDVQRFVGTYTSPAYQDLVVTAVDGQLRASLHGMPSSELFRTADGGFRVRGMDSSICDIAFDDDGEHVSAAHWRLEPTVDPIAFEHVASVVPRRAVRTSAPGPTMRPLR